MSGDSRFDALRQVLERRVPVRGPIDPSLSQAAVLLALRPTRPIELLLIERAEKEGDPWSGHMALPGGHREREDADLMGTALRETAEETGIVLARTAIMGELDEVRPSSRRRFPIAVAAFVAAVPASTRAVPAPAEVETALWVPLPYLARADAVTEILIELEEGSRAFPALTYREYVIWGLTHRILTGFMEVAREAGLV